MSKLETALPIKNWLLRNMSMCVLNVDDSQYITDKANDILRLQGKVADLTAPQVLHAMELLTYDELNTPITERHTMFTNGASQICHTKENYQPHTQPHINHTHTIS